MRRVTAMVLIVLMLLAATGAAAAESGTPAAASPQAMTGGLADFYQAATGYAPDPGYFGVYSIQPVGDALYLGLGTARPAESDGALLARLDGAGLTALAKLDEQGFVDMLLADGRIYIPGADPLDDWSLGNLYVHDVASGATTKLRTLPNTIHAWQARQGADGRLLVTVGRYLPEPGAAWPYRGGILTSADGGQTWTADDSPALGAHRTYDLVNGPGLDVALVDDASIDGCQLATRAPGGEWRRGAAWTLCRLRLLSDPAGRRVLAVGADARSLIVAGAEQRLRLPFGVEPWAYHWGVVVGRTLYVAGEGGALLATDNLRTWRTVAQLDGAIVTVASWPARNALVVATRGANAGLWRVDLAAAPSAGG